MPFIQLRPIGNQFPPSPIGERYSVPVYPDGQVGSHAGYQLLIFTAPREAQRFPTLCQGLLIQDLEI